MSDTYPTVWADDNSNEDRKSVNDWAQQHDIEAWLLPLKSRKDNPVEIVASYVDYLESVPKTQATFCSKDVGKQFHSGYATPMKSLLLLRQCESVHRQNRYVNPNYCHLGHHEPAIKDAEKRLAFWERFKYSPAVSTPWLATNWGVKYDAVEKFFRRRDMDYVEQMDANKRRFGRTLYTIWTWTDYSYRELGERMPMETKTVMNQMLKYGKNADDWEPPKRPQDEKWYNRDRAVIA